MKDSKKIVVIDADGDDRNLKGMISWPDLDSAHLAIDNYQQDNGSMNAMPWYVVEREEKVVGTYRKAVEAKFIPEGVAFSGVDVEPEL